MNAPGDNLRLGDIEDHTHIRIREDIEHQFALAFFQTYRTFLVHEADNEAIYPPLERMCRILKEILQKEGMAWIYTKNDALFVNHNRIPLPPQDFLLSRIVLEDLLRKGVGGLRFYRGLEREELKSVFIALVKAPAGYKDISGERMIREEYGVECSAPMIEELWTGELKQEMPSKVEALQNTSRLYLRMVSTVIQMRRRYDEPDQLIRLIRKFVRMFQRIIEGIREGEHMVFWMLPGLSMKFPQETHALHTALYTSIIGIEYELSRRQLLELILCGLFHDIGHWGEEDPHMQRETPEHVQKGVFILLKAAQLSTSLFRRVIVCIEHHRRLDESGYPPRPGLLPLHVFSKIVAVADAFDRLTLPTPGYRGMTPFQAWGVLFQHKKKLDQVALRCLYRNLGPFPPGSWLRLRDGSLCFVTRTQPARDGRHALECYICKKGPSTSYRHSRFIHVMSDDVNIQTALPYPVQSPPSAYFLTMEESHAGHDHPVL